MPNYFDQFDAPAAPAPQANYFDRFDAPQTPASTLGYIGSHLLGGLLEGGKQLGTAAAIEMGQPQQQADMAALPSGQETANKAIYGQPNVAAPNALARYGGAVASAAGANPVLSAIAPAYTAAGALGGEGGSDVNKAFGGLLPDWAARLAGSLVGGGVYGAGKALITAPDKATAALDRLADVKQRTESGEGLFGDFQQKVAKAAESVSPTKNPPPPISPTFPVPMTKTTALLTQPHVPMPTGSEALIAQLNREQTLPYGAIKPWLDNVGPGPLYQAIKGDVNAAIGPSAAAQLEQANRAAQATFLIGKAQMPTGLYNPAALTKQLAKNAHGDEIGSITPEMADMTGRAGELTDLTSPWMKANLPQPSRIGQLTRRLLGAGAAVASGHATGNPELGGIVAGSILAHPETGDAQILRLLYGIPHVPPGVNLLPGVLPSASAGLLSAAAGP